MLLAPASSLPSSWIEFGRRPFPGEQPRSPGGPALGLHPEGVGRMTETAGVHLRWQQCHVTGVTDHRAFLDCSPASHVSASSLIPSQKSCSHRDGACSCLTQLNLQPSQSRAPTGLCRSAGTCLERTGQDPSWLTELSLLTAWEAGMRVRTQDCAGRVSLPPAGVIRPRLVPLHTGFWRGPGRAPLPSPMEASPPTRCPQSTLCLVTAPAVCSATWFLRGCSQVPR